MLFEDILANAPVPHEDGHFISAEISRIVDLIREYDSHLDVKWIPPNMRRDGDAAFTIVERAADGKEYPIFTIDTEEHFNANVLSVIYAADTAKNDVMGRIDASNNAAKALERRRNEEKMQEAHEFAYSLLRSPLHTYRHDGKVIRR